MPTFKITLAYDGTDFVGWQRQASGRSVQGLLEEALRELDGRDISVTGAGRTDAGVHALGQVASFALERAIEPAVLVRALNARLPDTVRVWSASRVAPTFNARFDARAKRYRYRISNGPLISPFDRQYAWHVSSLLDAGAMAEAARRFEGRHDFAAFQGAGSEVATTERTITVSRIVVPGISTTEDAADAEDQPPLKLQRSADHLRARLRWFAEASAKAEALAKAEKSCLDESQRPPVELPDLGFDLRVLRGGAFITYDVVADGFLRHMVRTIVGTLVDVGRGRRTPESIDAVLAARDRSAAGPTAPARGLFLVAVEYAALAAEP
jgi:tRNA pseudouridine38-40 synthase